MHADNQNFHHTMLVHNIKHFIRRYNFDNINTIHGVLASLYRSRSFLFKDEVVYEGIRITASPDRVLKLTITI